MSIEFEEDQNIVKTYDPAKVNNTSIIGIVISAGIAKTEKGAEIFLLTLTIILFVLSGYLLIKNNSDKKNTIKCRDKFTQLELSKMPPEYLLKIPACKK